MLKVYFIRAGKDLKNKLPKLFDAVSEDLDFKNEKIGVKLHFGEKGNTTYVKPELVKMIVNKIKEKNGNPDLIECCVLYRSERTTAEGHIKLAKEHGFDFAPIVILDGEIGDDYTEIPVNLKHFKKVRIGSKIKDYKFIVSVAHFKGHGGTGFGGSLKNIGMGLGSRAGKLKMHSKVKPIVNKSRCTACGTCVANCPVSAIALAPYAKIDDNICIGCAKCIAVCPYKAIGIPWGGASQRELQERIDEYAYGVLKDRKAIFFSFLLDITPNCDCFGYSETPIVKDIGILASKDIIAIEQASYDLVCEDGNDKFAELHNIDSSIQLKYGEKIGLGKRKYELIEL